MPKSKLSLLQFQSLYGTHEQCLEVIKQQRFPEPYECPKCKTQQKFYHVKGRAAYACNKCGHHLYPLAGTIFEKTKIPLQYWFYAMYLMSKTLFCQEIVGARQGFTCKFVISAVVYSSVILVV